jgi:hypothetical protein
MRFSAWVWVGGFPTCDHHHPTRAARSSARLNARLLPHPPCPLWMTGQFWQR